MNNRFTIGLGVALVALAFVHTAAAQSPLPANVQADRAAIQQDASNLHTLHAQLRTDEGAGNDTATAADRTALRLARMQLMADFGKLHQDAQGVLQPDRAALTAALTQLHSDQVANNASAVQSDQSAVQNAETQLRTDRMVVFGDLQIGHGMHRGHWRG
jgi:hypothetical protein